jgi:hypothetical protein
MFTDSLGTVQPGKLVLRNLSSVGGGFPFTVRQHERAQPGHCDHEPGVPQHRDGFPGCGTGYAEFLLDLHFRRDRPLGLDLPALNALPDDAGYLAVARHRCQRVVLHDRDRIRPGQAHTFGYL